MLEQEIEATLLRLVQCSGLESRLSSAIQYAVLNGGKRVRPRLALAFCHDLGGDASKLLQPAASLELLHSASLVHDDLPALDNDDMRRGRPSCHKQFDEATALLAGDAMISLAQNVVCGSGLPAAVCIEMSRRLSRGFLDLCSGQQLDVAATQGRDLQKIHELKTGALFSVATAFGALGAGLDAEAVRESADIGRAIGLGFQIVDDFVDLFGTDELRGRSGSSDEKNHKETFFNRNDPAKGFELLSATQSKVYTLLDAFAANHKDLPAGFNVTHQIVSSIFERTKSIRRNFC